MSYLNCVYVPILYAHMSVCQFISFYLALFYGVCLSITSSFILHVCQLDSFNLYFEKMDFYPSLAFYV